MSSADASIVYYLVCFSLEIFVIICTPYYLCILESIWFTFSVFRFIFIRRYSYFNSRLCYYIYLVNCLNSGLLIAKSPSFLHRNPQFSFIEDVSSDLQYFLISSLSPNSMIVSELSTCSIYALINSFFSFLKFMLLLMVMNLSSPKKCLSFFCNYRFGIITVWSSFKGSSFSFLVITDSLLGELFLSLLVTRKDFLGAILEPFP